MKKMHKSQDYFKFSKKDLYKILYSKSKYLKNLENKKNESYNLINNQKIEILKDKLIRANNFNRDYSVFSKEKLYLKPQSNYPPRFYFTPDIKPLILSPEEINEPNRYRKKKFDIDEFSLMYRRNNNISNYSTKNSFLVSNKSKLYKFNEKKKLKKNEESLENCFIDLEDKNNFNISNRSKMDNNNNNILNGSSTSKIFPSFLTSVGNNIVINNSKKSV